MLNLMLFILSFVMVAYLTAWYWTRFLAGRNRSDLLSAIFWMLTLPLILLFIVISWISEQVERGLFR